jgi:HEAT repeat protein
MVPNSVEGSSLSLKSQAQEIAKLLSKAAKNYQVYLPNNRMFLSSLEELKAALDTYLEENEILTFVVREFELLYDKTPVYSNTDKHQSLAFRMYRDGVRLISFHHGITNDEILSLFEAFTKCMEIDNLEEDFVTLLWEKDLQSITYYEVNDFENHYRKVRKDVGERADTARTWFQPDAADREWTNASEDEDRIKPKLAFTPNELEEVQNLAIVVEDDFFPNRAWQVILWTLTHSSQKVVYVDLEAVLIGLLDTCLEKKLPGFAAEILSEVRSRYSAVGDQEISSVLSRIVSSRLAERNMGMIGDCLSTNREALHEQCFAYLSRLGEDAIPWILRLLPKCTHRSARQALVMSLAALGEDRPERIARCAYTATPEESEAVLDVLETIGTQTALASAAEFRHHSSAKIRAKVATMATRLNREKGSELAQALLNDPDPSVRRRALGSLVEVGGEEAVDTLVRIFTSKEFRLLPRDRKIGDLLLIRKLPPPGQRQIMLTILRLRSFFKRKAVEEIKIALIEVMHLMDPDVVYDLLKQMEEGSSRNVRRAARIALRKVRDV